MVNRIVFQASSFLNQHRKRSLSLSSFLYMDTHSYRLLLSSNCVICQGCVVVMETFLSFAISLPVPCCQRSVTSKTLHEINRIAHNNDQRLDLSQDDKTGYQFCVTRKTHIQITQGKIYSRAVSRALSLFCDVIKY